MTTATAIEEKKVATTTPAEAPSTTNDPEGLPKEFLAELDAAIEASDSDDEKKKASEDESAVDEKKDLPPSKSQEGEDKEESSEEDEEAPTGQTDDRSQEAEGKQSGITDAHLERAIRAGMSVSDVHTFQSPELLERVVSMMEKASAAGSGTAEKKEEAEEVVDDATQLLSQIPDLDPEEYEAELVSGFKALKGIIEKQQQVIKGLSTQNKAQDEGWFDSQVRGLSAAATDVLKNQPEKAVVLRDKFNVLSAGYKASGKDVSKDSVFKEAVAVVFGDVEAKAATTLKADKLEKRAGQKISRPTSASVKAKGGDVFDEVAKEVNEKYFKDKP
jgi:hypothetical protein